MGRSCVLAILLCVLTLTFALNSASAQSPKPRIVQPMQVQWQPNRLPSQPQGQYFCNSTKPTGYPTLTLVPRNDGYVEYAGTPLTWTPIGNATACDIRQISFNVPDIMDNGTCP
jgi:hypothetical protein